MRILFLNQAFHPDVVSTAQHASDLASELARRGHEVHAIASSRAYDSPRKRFGREESWEGVSIHRIGCAGFGKGAKWRRALDFATYLLGCALCLLRFRRCDLVIAMTSPPLISFLAGLFVALKGGSLLFWIMDLNPDEAIAAGWLRDGSTLARMLSGVLRFSLRKSEAVVVLDRFMKQRVEEKSALRRVEVIPPWSHDRAVHYSESGRDRFRRRHKLDGKYVIMYSGNHSPCHPLGTLLAAARELRSEPDYVFCFVGGGSEFRKAQDYAVENRLSNILCLPYQPLSELSGSLSAADLHVVVFGEPFVGIVHPCKVYNILALGIPFLYIGPQESHVMDMVPPEGRNRWVFVAGHGNVPEAVDRIRHARSAAESHSLSQLAVGEQFSCRDLTNSMVGLVEAAARGRVVHVPAFRTTSD